MVALLEEIVSILVGGITGLGEGIATGVGATAKALFVTGAGTDSDPYKLSVFGGIIVVFAGLSLAVGLTRLVYMMITSFAARK